MTYHMVLQTWPVLTKRTVVQTWRVLSSGTAVQMRERHGIVHRAPPQVPYAPTPSTLPLILLSYA
eukprot:994865-Rhodomonas_salina.1